MPKPSGNKSVNAKVKAAANQQLPLAEGEAPAEAAKPTFESTLPLEINWYENLKQLTYDIIHRQYKPGRSKAFITRNPVIREIFAAPFRDRIVHHLLYGIVAPWWDDRFIYDSYSCRYAKGTMRTVIPEYMY